MKHWTWTDLLVAALFATPSLVPSVGMAKPPAHPKILSFDAPGAGTAPNQGTGCFGCTFGLNIWGQIAGTYLDANNVYHGFLRNPDGKIVSFEEPAADTTVDSFNGTYAQNINDAGVITGYYFDATGVAHGFVRSPEGGFSSFDAPDAVNGTFPLALNLEGAVVGYALDANLLFHAFIRNPNGRVGTFVGPASCTSGTPAGCYGSEATFIGLFGNSVGNYEDNSGNFVGHGLIRSVAGKLTTFDAPGAGTGPYQGTGCPGCNFGVNLQGAIAGTYVDSGSVIHGFLRSANGKVVSFDAPGAGSGEFQGTGCFSDCAISLNNFGVAVGSYVDAGYVQHGFQRAANGDITTIDPIGSTGTQPEVVNDWGTVAGYYFDADGVAHGFVFSP